MEILMNIVGRRQWPMIVLAAWPLFLGGHVAAQSLQAVEKPALLAFDSWTYRRINLWKNEEDERFRQDILGGVGDHLTVQWTIISSADERRRGSVTQEYLDAATHAFFDPKAEGRHVPLLFPLHPGKRWQFQYKYNPAAGGSLKVEQSAVVEGWEDVRVPAGTFRALKVVHAGRYWATTDSGYQWSGVIRETYWYAAEAKRVVRMEYQDTAENGSKWDHWRDELVSMTVYPSQQRK